MDTASSARTGRASLPEGEPSPPSVGLVPWDVRTAVRAASVGALAFSVAWLVTAATDEGGISWAERSGRVLPLAPFCSAVGAWAVLLHAVVRGETRALAALGRSEGFIALPAVLGATCVSLVTSLVIASIPRIALDGFYPAAVHASSWAWRDGLFVDLTRGVAVGANAEPMWLRGIALALAPSGPPIAGRAAAVIATSAAGLALPLMASHFVLMSAPRSARPRRRWEGRLVPGLGSVLTVGLTAALFQSAAAARSPALLATVPPLALLVYAVALFRRPR